MVCPICKNEGILNSANHKEFYYCRTCKIEIDLEIVTPALESRLTQEEIDELFNSIGSVSYP